MSTARAYYNELDMFPAQWLRNLSVAGHVPFGLVDQRSIRDVQADDVRNYYQCHFFAGIGGWSRALRLAGVPDDFAVWTGSCPCQPFSVAGKQRGFADDRHLWPEWFRLIRECRPAIIFGEQVGGPAGLAWLDAVFADLEGIGYACGAANLPAASVGAPHIRQRLFFVAHLLQAGRGQRRFAPGPAKQRNGSESFRCCEAYELANAAARGQRIDGGASWNTGHADQCGQAVWMGDSEREGTRRDAGTVPCPQGEGGGERCEDWRVSDGAVTPGADGSMADADGGEQGDREIQRSGRELQPSEDAAACFWSDVIWLPCSDGKARPTKPGIEPLAHGVPGRVGRLRGYGNAIVPQVAAEFIRVAMEVLPC